MRIYERSYYMGPGQLKPIGWLDKRDYAMAWYPKQGRYIEGDGICAYNKDYESMHSGICYYFDNVERDYSDKEMLGLLGKVRDLYGEMRIRRQDGGMVDGHWGTAIAIVDNGNVVMKRNKWDDWEPYDD